MKMATANEHESYRGNKDHEGGRPRRIRGVTLYCQGATPEGGHVRLDDRRSIRTRSLMEGKAGGSEPNERIREPARTISKDGPAVLGFMSKPLASVVVVLAPG
jgi:hypothetical protein